MRLIHALGPLVYTQPMVFLAGPTPRSTDGKSWRPEMIAHFDDINRKSDHAFSDVLLVLPEDSDGVFHGNYNHQTEWEELAIGACDVLLFWIPRDIEEGMPGFTTNVEFGYWMDKKENIVFGHPVGADKMSYLRWRFRKSKRKEPHRSAVKCAEEALEIIRRSSSVG